LPDTEGSINGDNHIHHEKKSNIIQSAKKVLLTGFWHSTAQVTTPEAFLMGMSFSSITQPAPSAPFYSS
jgi:hypothetical protein